MTDTIQQQRDRNNRENARALATELARQGKSHYRLFVEMLDQPGYTVMVKQGELSDCEHDAGLSFEESDGELVGVFCLICGNRYKVA